MRIAVAQIDPVVGAFDSNVKKIKEAYQRACSKDADFLLTPELGVCGYPPHDLVERPEMFERSEKAVAELMAATRGQSCALIVGHVAVNPSDFGRAAQNVVTVLQDGRRVFRQAKTLLPTYDVFDEARYFEPAESVQLWNCKGTPVAVAICEDLWAHDPRFRRPIYREDPLAKYQKLGAKLIVSISSSPYDWNKRDRREQLHAHVAETLQVPLVYVNQSCANDEILFDGGSFALDAKGKLLGRLPLFKTAFGIIDTETGEWELPSAEHREDEAPAEIEVLTRGLVTGIRDYFARTGFKTAILGLSGGIDSAVVATLAARALGPKSVLGVAMPSQHSSPGSLRDAEALAKSLGIAFEVRPIKFLYATVNRELSEGRGELAPIALENLQSRLRGMTLMTLSNHYNALVLSTGNKSELATGYCTLYGDMCGALNPIGDVLKTRVYELARHLNEGPNPPIPQESLTKAPSAELRPNQTDQDTLPPYDLLDALLEAYVEQGVSVVELEERFAGKPIPVSETIRKLEINEFKRRQSSPVLRVSSKAFGIGRRMPVAKIWNP